MENLTENKEQTVQEQQHLEALKQKEIDSQQLLEYIQFNTMTKSTVLEEELMKILNDSELTDKIKREIARCIQISRGYTEYKVLTIAEATGFNRTRTKTLIQYLINNNKLELISLENTTFLKLA